MRPMGHNAVYPNISITLVWNGNAPIFITNIFIFQIFFIEIWNGNAPIFVLGKGKTPIWNGNKRYIKQLIQISILIPIWDVNAQIFIIENTPIFIMNIFVLQQIFSSKFGMKIHQYLQLEVYQSLLFTFCFITNFY